MSIYDVSGELNSPKVDARLHEYWTECQLHRREQQLSDEEFAGCMQENARDSGVPFATRMKLLKFTGVRAA